MTQTLSFTDPQLLEALPALHDAALDELPFGVIAFGADRRVVRYNRYESQAAAFPVERVLGQHVFIELAPCMNNYLVGGRFDDTEAAGQPLDEVLPYVLTLRMMPTPVQLRLLSAPWQPLRYVLVQRRGTGT